MRFTISVRAVATLDLVIARATKGTVMLTKMAIMAITTSISTSVKPRRVVMGMNWFELDFMVLVLIALPVTDGANFVGFADLYPEVVTFPIVLGVA